MMPMMKRVERILLWFDRGYILLMCVVASMVIAFQIHKDFGHLAIYEDYARIIRAGLNGDAALFAPHTCPMWGYAFPVLVTQSKLLFLLLQNALGILAAWVFVGALGQRGSIFSAMQVRVLKALLLFSLPWYAFNSMLGPQSIAANLLVISFVLLMRPMPERIASLGRVALSGICFGVLLNFRSDFHLLPLALALAALCASRFSAPILARSALWICCIYAMLIPWGIYTRSVTGQYRFASTNSGHVLFVGLGSRPANKWGVTQNDNDPVMMDLVARQCGKGEMTCAYKGDALLKRAWFERVRNDPLEYLRGCAYSLGHMMIGGVYAGEFDPEFSRRIKRLLRGKSLRDVIADNPLIWVDFINLRVALNLLSDMTGRLVVLLAFFLFPFALFVALRGRHVIVLLMCAAIAHQWLINMFVSNVRSYMSSVYLFYVATIVYAAGIIWRHHSSASPEPDHMA